MTIPTQPLPTVGQPNSTEDPKVRSALSELQTILTAGIDSTNLTGGALTSQVIPHVKVRRETSFTIPGGGWTVVEWVTELYDLGTPSNNMHDNVTNNSRLTCRVAGLYNVTAKVGFTSAAATGGSFRSAAIWVNGAAAAYTIAGPPGGTSSLNLPLTCPVRLAVGDYVELAVNHDIGSPVGLDASNNDRTFLAAYWASA